MKRTTSQPEFTTLEHISVTVSRINRDKSGKQTINRTYISTRRKVNQLDTLHGDLIPEDAGATEEVVNTNRSTEQKPLEKLVQLCLFLT